MENLVCRGRRTRRQPPPALSLFLEALRYRD
jgi:hypothetical protein